LPASRRRPPRPVSACQQAEGDPRDRFLLASKPGATPETGFCLPASRRRPPLTGFCLPAGRRRPPRRVAACQQAGGDPRDRFLLASKRPWLRARSPSGKKRARLGSINYPPAATPGRGRYCIVTRYGGIASRSGNKEFSLTDPVNVAVVV